VTNSAFAKADALARDRVPWAVTMFAEWTDMTDPRIMVTPTVLDVLRVQEFWDADLHIFEFAMGYDLLQVVPLLVGRVPVMVVDHNTTPPDLVDPPRVKAAIDRAMRMRDALAGVDMVLCDSEFTRDELVALGSPPDRLTVLHLPPHNSGRSPADRSRRPHEPVGLLFVGRFSRAKGVRDLIDAFERLQKRREAPFSLTLAGSARFSDPELVAHAEELARRHAGRFVVHLDLDDDAVAQLFAGADVLVLPSYHEGYCVPVVEALSSECYVISYDGTNLPNVMGGLGSLVPTGDVEGLAGAMGDVVERIWTARANGVEPVLPTASGPMDRSTWCARVGVHLQAYSEAHFEETFLDAVGRVLARRAEGPWWACAGGPIFAGALAPGLR
jgi:glycosyltransferase involved in cell wall biosynthesis